MMDQVAGTKEKLSLAQIDIVDQLSKEAFYRDYVDRAKPVVIRNLAKDWKALNWGMDYFKAKEGGVKLAVKTGDLSEGKREMYLLSEYIALLEKYEEQLKNGETPPNPGYLHDVPLFYLMPHLIPDIEPFPTYLFPEWYHENWHNYIQFFMGATNSLTPLHFDTLCTNNLFFQIVGKKKFILIPENEKDYCYMNGWRWAKFNPAEPDFDTYPLARKVNALEVVIGPGDILYIPSGMLHQVHGLSYSISFNIDWHTPESAKKGVMTLFQGAPKQNIYYNMLSYLGVGWNVPPKYIFPFYKSYLNYVS